VPNPRRSHTPFYWYSPELARGLPTGPPHASFLVGLALHALLEGRSPFPGRDSSAWLEALRDQPALPIERRDVSAVVVALIDAALRTPPAERVPLAELAASLDAELARLGGDPAPVLRAFLADAFAEERARQLDFLEQLQAADLTAR
jgi:hypothetical protein